MDCNSIIYDAFRQIEGEDHDDTIFYNKVIDMVIVIIESYIEFISPSDLVYIAFDGVAPFAKMEQQRSRRNRSAYMSTITFDDIPKKVQPQRYSTAMITPGTQFMQLLSLRVARHFDHGYDGQGGRRIIVSGSIECGEGEHKMFQHMRDHKSPGSIIAVYGLDSDLIMLSIFHCLYFGNIYIFREAPEFMKSAIPIKPTNKDEPYFMNIRKLADRIVHDMRCENTDYSRLYDYVFLCFFLGNDFLPHFPALNIRTNGIDALMETYRTHIGKWLDRRFIHDGVIQWKWVSKYVGELAKIEHELILEQYVAREKMGVRDYAVRTSEERENAFNNIPMIYRMSENYICPRERLWEERYYGLLFRQSYGRDLVNSVSANYLEGLEWVFKYYTVGCADWKWAYHYLYPPLLTDLVRHIPISTHEFIGPNDNRAFTPKTQLAYVLPRESFHLMNGANRTYLLEHAKQYYVDVPEFEWAFCRYFWESHVVLPSIPMSVLENWDCVLTD